MKSQNFQKIRQLYAKRGLTKNRTSLLSESSVFIVRSVADYWRGPVVGALHPDPWIGLQP